MAHGEMVLSDDADDTSHALVVRLQQRDPAAITRVYREHHVAVRRFAQRLVGDIEAAEDLVQDVFVALPSAIARFRGDCALRTFLVSIAVNHARHFVRAAARRRAAGERMAAEPTGSSRSPDEDLERQRLARALSCALDGLSLDHRVAFVLCVVEERTSSEASEILGIPEGTVRTRVFHAKQKLRQRLQRGGLP